MYARPLTALLVLALSSPALAFGWGVAGNGKVTTEARNAQGFKRVELRAPIDAQVKEGTGFSVSLTIDSNLQPLITTEVKATRSSWRPGRASAPPGTPGWRSPSRSSGG